MGNSVFLREVRDVLDFVEANEQAIRGLAQLIWKVSHSGQRVLVIGPDCEEIAARLMCCKYPVPTMPIEGSFFRTIYDVSGGMVEPLSIQFQSLSRTGDLILVCEPEDHDVFLPVEGDTLDNSFWTAGMFKAQEAQQGSGSRMEWRLNFPGENSAAIRIGQMVAITMACDILEQWAARDDRAEETALRGPSAWDHADE